MHLLPYFFSALCALAHALPQAPAAAESSPLTLLISSFSAYTSTPDSASSSPKSDNYAAFLISSVDYTWGAICNLQTPGPLSSANWTSCEVKGNDTEMSVGFQVGAGFGSLEVTKGWVNKDGYVFQEFSRTHIW
jgi:hypothetical protein